MLTNCPFTQPLTHYFLFINLLYMYDCRPSHPLILSGPFDVKYQIEAFPLESGREGVGEEK